MTFNPLKAERPPKLVMFDLDGTLVDSVPDLHAAVSDMLSAMQLHKVSLEQVKSWVGNGAAMLVKRALSNNIKVDAVSEAKYFDTASSLFFQYYHQRNGECAVPYKDSLALINLLVETGLSVAIITNKPEQFTLPLLQKLEIKVDLVLSGDSLDKKKPDPAPILHCLKHFDLSCEEALMIGDSVSDIEAAKAANVPNIAVSYGYNHGQSAETLNANLVVDSLTELIQPSS